MRHIDRDHGLPDYLKRLAQRIAQHEMGHYVVARLMGFQTDDVTLEIIGPMDGHRGEASVTLTEALTTLEDVESYLRARLKVLYAGAIAETLQPSAPNKSVDVDAAVEIFQKEGNGAENDNAKARELMQVLRNIRFAETDKTDEPAIQGQLDSLCQEIWSETVELVEEHADAILGLAGNLASQVKRPKEEAVLEAASLEALHGVQALVPRRTPK